MDRKETIKTIIDGVRRCLCQSERGYIEGIDVTYNYDNDSIKIDNNVQDFHFRQYIASQIECCQLDEIYLMHLCQNICCNYVRDFFKKFLYRTLTN